MQTENPALVLSRTVAGLTESAGMIIQEGRSAPLFQLPPDPRLDASQEIASWATPERRAIAEIGRVGIAGV
jgi:hypothetical protein